MPAVTLDLQAMRDVLGDDASDVAIERLSATSRVYSAPTRTLLLRRGDPTKELSVLTNGRAAISDHLPGRGSVRLLTIGPGELFGWTGVIEPYTAVSDVISLTRVDVVAFGAEQLREAMDADCELARSLDRLLLRSLSKRLLQTRHQLFDLFGAGWAEPIYEPW